MQTTTFRRLDLRPSHVTLVLRNLKIEGTVYVEPGHQRFSDAWDGFLRHHDRHRFFPVTEATVSSFEASEPVATAPFMMVDREEVIAVVPAE